MFTKTALASGVLTFLLAGGAWACTGGQEWTNDVNGYTIDVTDDTPAIDPGQPVHFDFGLYTKSADTYGEPVPAPFTTVQAALMHGKDIVFTKVMAAQKDRELTGFDQTFPDRNGDFTLGVRFLNENGELAATVIPITIGKGDVSLPNGLYAAVGSLGILLVVLAAIGATRGHKPARRRR